MHSCIFFALALIISTNAEPADTIVKSNLKQIINNALDALVSLEDESADINTRAAEMLSRDAVENDGIMVNDDEDDDNFLGNEIKELEKMLTLEKKNSEDKKPSYVWDMSAHALKGDSSRKRELEQEAAQVKRGILLGDQVNAKREAMSREEKATVVVDNDNLKNLVDLVVRTLDEDAANKEALARVAEADTSKLVKKELTEQRANEKKEIMDSGKKQEAKKEIVEEHKPSKKEVKASKENEVKKELCNARKRECVEKKSATVTDNKMSKKTTKTTKNSKKENEETNDDKEIRGIVERILEGKNEEVRDAFASLIENVFEKAERKNDNNNNKKKEINKK